MMVNNWKVMKLEFETLNFEKSESTDYYVYTVSSDCFEDIPTTYSLNSNYIFEETNTVTINTNKK